MSATGQPVRDMWFALAIGLFVALRSVVLGRQVLAVLAQHVPEGVDLTAVVADLESVPGVAEVHDLHVWALTSGMDVATAHLVTAHDASPQAVLTRAQEVLAVRHHIEHATLETESAPTKQCHEVTW